MSAVISAKPPVHPAASRSSARKIVERPLQRYASEFYIDITKCVFCGYCVEACPVNALAMTKMYEFSTHDKRTLLFDKKRLYEIGERHLDDAKKYLYAHNQEKNVEESREYRYYFPQSVHKVDATATQAFELSESIWLLCFLRILHWSVLLPAS